MSVFITAGTHNKAYPEANWSNANRGWISLILFFIPAPREDSRFHKRRDESRNIAYSFCIISRSVVKYDMTREERENKGRRIKEKGEATRLRHASIRPVVVELKLDLKCLNNAERNKLFLYFTECRWLCNYLLGLSSDMFRDFDTRTRCVTSLDMTQRLLQMCSGFPKGL